MTWSWSVSIQPTFTKDPEKRICRSGHLDKTDDDGREMVHAPDAEDERVTVTSSARDPGWGLYLKDGKSTFTMNLLDITGRSGRAPTHCRPASTLSSLTGKWSRRARPSHVAAPALCQFNAKQVAQSERPPFPASTMCSTSNNTKKFFPTPAPLSCLEFSTMAQCDRSTPS